MSSANSRWFLITEYNFLYKNEEMMKKQYLILVITTLEALFIIANSQPAFKITSSSLESPNYPDNYPKNFELSYNIPIPPGKKLILTFITFDLEAVCSTDFVAVIDYEGTWLGNTFYCGSDGPGTFIIEGTFATVLFKSGNGIGGTGFRADWVYRVDGHFTTWSSWRMCTKTCGPGKQTRNRNCTNPAPAYGGIDCQGQTNETRDCYNTGCPVAVNGSFSEWGNWSECSRTCGGGKQNRSRSCTNPPPVGGGAYCVGPANEIQDCNTQVICPVNGSFSAWGNWSECSRTCGVGKKNRSRSCTNPPPVGGGTDCVGPANEIQDCNTTVICPGWSIWSSWSIQNNSCDTRIRARSRNCIRYSPEERHLHCTGPASETEVCHYHGYCLEANNCCILHEVRIVNLQGDAVSTPTIVTRSTTFTVHGSVGNYCPVVNGTVMEWRVRDLDSPDNTSVRVSSKNIDWTIMKGNLEIGRYVIEFSETSVDAANLTSRAYGYLKMKASSLVARIVGGAFLLQGYDNILTLDASQSYDPDAAIGNYTDMKFTWLCKKSNETYPPHSYLPTNNLSVIDMTGSKSQGLGGCFGTGIGKLNITKRAVQLHTSLLRVGESYDFTLTVTKGDRYSSFVQSVKIVEGDPLPFEIRCFSNCGAKMDPSSRLRLTTFCNGTCDYSVRYLWTLFEITAWDKGKAATKPVNYLLENTLTRLEYDNLAVKENALHFNQDYRISVKIDVYGFDETVAVYDFTTNGPPTGGECNVDPATGEALVTKFEFRCYGWADDDMPVRYKVYYKMDETLYTLASYGMKHSFSIGLPQGKAAKIYEVQTKVNIVDSLGAASTVYLSVKVFPPKQNEQLRTTLKELIVGETSELSSMVATGDVESTTQLANAVLSSLEHVDPTVQVTKEDKTEIKDSIIVAMAAITPKTLDTVSQITAVLKKATEQPEEVSISSQKIIVELVESITAVLGSEDKSSVESLVRHGGESLVKTVGNVMYAASRGARRAYEKSWPTLPSTLETTTTETQYVQQSQNIVVTSIGQVSKIGSTLLARKIVGEPPTVIKSSSLSMLLDRQRPEAINGSKIEEGNNSFVLPPVDELLESHNKDITFLDSQMLTIPFNPYTWDKRADKVSSNVVSLQLTDNTGTPIIVDNLKSKINIIIPRRPDVKNVTLKGDGFFIKPSKDGMMQYHVVTVDLDRSSMKIKINTKPGVQFTAYVKFRNRPTIDTYDYRTTVPDFSSCVEVFEGQYTGCQMDPYTMFLSGSVLQQAGTYYIGIQYERDSNDTTPDRRKRSCVGSKRQKRSCVETKDAPTLPVQIIPLNESAVLVYDPNTDQNYTMVTWQSSCLYWSIEDQSWTTRGCEASPESTEDTIYCLCDHLTAFGGVFLVAPNPIDFDKVFLEISRLDRTGSIAVLSTIIVLLSLYVAVVVIARRTDNRDQDKIGPPLCINPDAGEVYQYEVTVNTGVWKKSGTTSNVSIVMHGSEATSAPIVLYKNIAPGRVILARGSTDKLYINLPQRLGTIKRLQVSHDNSGPKPSWFLSSVIVRDMEEDQTTRFMCNRWFALEREDGKIVRSVFPTSEKKFKSFKSKFDSRVSKNYADNHLWLSVITKTPKSTFTRVQRATCCLTLLFSVMIANAMFYRLDKTSDQTIQVGPLKFSPRQVAIGVQSCLIVTPVNIFIVWLFRNSQPPTKREKPEKNEKERKVENQEAGMVDLSCVTLEETSDMPELPNGLRESHPSSNGREDSEQSLETSHSENYDGKRTIDIEALNLHILPRFRSTSVASGVLDFAENCGSSVIPSESRSSAFNVLDFTSSIEKAIGDEYFVQYICEDEDISEEESEKIQNLYRNKRRRLRSIVELELGEIIDSRHHFCAISEEDIKKEEELTKSENIEHPMYCSKERLEPTVSAQLNVNGYVTVLSPTAVYIQEREDTTLVKDTCDTVESTSSPGESSSSIHKEQDSKYLNPSPSQHCHGKETSDNLQSHEDSIEFDSATVEYERFVIEHKLPYWCGWIAWFLCFAIVVISASFTFFYSLMWGKEIANQWLSSTFVSFVQELFFNQPIKMFAVMVVLAWILKKPAKEITAGWASTVKGRCNVKECGTKNDVKIVIPDEEELEKSREYRTKERKMFHAGRELITYVVFLFLLMTVCYGNRTEYGFLMTQDIKNTFSGFDKVGDTNTFFTWMGVRFIPGIYAGTWYNDANEHLQEYIGNKRSLLVGMPRLRQLRVQEGSCEVPEKAKQVATSCYDFYSFREEDHTPFSLPGWVPFTDILQVVAPTDVCPKPWRYESRNSLKSVPLWGYFAIYDGGGYVADLGYNGATAIDVMADLVSNKWIDRKSRVIVVEFSIFNANTNYFSICTFFYEILPTGYRNSFQKIETVALYHTDSVLFEVWLVCQFFFMGLVFYYLALQIYKMWQQKCHYFNQLWNWIDLAQTITALLAVGFYMIKAKTILDAVLKVQKNPYENVNFHKALQWVEAENLVLSIAVFIGTTKFLRLIRFNFEINIMTSTIRVSKGALLSYVVVLFCIILAFTQAGYLIFGSTVLKYSTFTRTLVSEMEMALGGATDLNELRNTNRILGAIFAFSFMAVMAFVLVNIFVAILNDSYHDVKEHPQLVSKDHEIGQFIKDRLVQALFQKDHTGKAKSKSQQISSLEEDCFCSRFSNSYNLLQEHPAANISNKRAYFLVQKKEDNLNNQLELLEYLVDALCETVEAFCTLELSETCNSKIINSW